MAKVLLKPLELQFFELFGIWGFKQSNAVGLWRLSGGYRPFLFSWEGWLRPSAAKAASHVDSIKFTVGIINPNVFKKSYNFASFFVAQVLAVIEQLWMRAWGFTGLSDLIPYLDFWREFDRVNQLPQHPPAPSNKEWTSPSHKTKQKITKCWEARFLASPRLWVFSPAAIIFWLAVFESVADKSLWLCLERKQVMVGW